MPKNCNFTGKLREVGLRSPKQRIKIIKVMYNREKNWHLTINKIERQLPHTCAIVTKVWNAVVKKRKDILKTLSDYFVILLIITGVLFLSNIIY